MTNIFFTYGMVLWCILYFFFFYVRPRLFKIHWIILYPVDSTMVSLMLVDWIVIYPMNSAIQLLNSWGQVCQILVMVIFFSWKKLVLRCFFRF